MRYPQSSDAAASTAQMRQQCGSALHKFSRCDNFQSCTRSQREKQKRMAKFSISSRLLQVARFKDLRSSAEAFADTRLPQYQRQIYNIIGRRETEYTNQEPMIADNRDFNLAMMKSNSGKGSSNRSMCFLCHAAHAWAPRRRLRTGAYRSHPRRHRSRQSDMVTIY